MLACVLAFVFACALAFMLACVLPFVVMVTLALLMLTLPPDMFVFAMFVFDAMLVFVAMFVFEAFEFVAFMLPLPLSAGEQAVQRLATARRVRSAKVLRI